MIAKHNPYIGQLYPIVIPIWLARIITQNRPKQPGFFHCSSGRCFGCIKYDQPEESGCFGVLKMTPLGEIGFLGNYQILPKRKRINFDLIPPRKNGHCSWFLCSVYKKRLQFLHALHVRGIHLKDLLFNLTTVRDHSTICTALFFQSGPGWSKGSGIGNSVTCCPKNQPRS